MNNGLLERPDGRLGHLLILIAVCAGMFLVNLGGASLWDRDEGRNAAAAIAMNESGDLIVPKFNGNLRVDKPALLYWLQVSAYRLFGVSEFSARLPSALAALVTVLLAYELGRRLFGPATGLLSGLILASTPLVCAAARFANPDALLNLFSVLTLLLFWLGYARNGRLRFAAMGCAAGLAMLAKGPVGLVLPGAVIFLFLLWQRQLALLWDRRLLWGLLAFILIALPWYIWVAVDTKANFLRGFILTHNVNRFLNPMEHHHGSVFYYLAVLLVGFTPWSVFLGLAAWYGLWSVVWRPWSAVGGVWAGAADYEDRTAQEENSTSEQPTLYDEVRMPGYRFLWCWIAVYLVFFSLAATKLPNYILPATVPTALLIGRFLERWRMGAIEPPRWAIHLCLASLLLVGVGTALGLVLVGGVWELPALRGRYFPGLEYWAVLGLLPILGAIGAWSCLRRQSRTGLVVSVTLATLVFIGPLAAWATAAFNPFKATQPLVEISETNQRDRDLRVGCWQLEYLPSLNFYCQRDVVHLAAEANVLTFLRQPLPVYLFVPLPEWQQLAGKIRTPHREISRHYDMYRGCDVVVVTNQ